MSRSRSHRVDLRLDDVEVEAITALSKGWGCSVSDALRRLVRESRTGSVRTPSPAVVEPVRTPAPITASEKPRRQTGDEACAELGITPRAYLGNPFAD